MKVKDWVNKWKEQFGDVKDEGDNLLLLEQHGEQKDSFHPYVYEGHFLDVPEEFYECDVKEQGRIIASSVPAREGAYVLNI